MCIWWCRLEFVNEWGTEWSAPPLYEWRHDSVNTSIWTSEADDHRIQESVLLGLIDVVSEMQSTFKFRARSTRETFCLEDQEKNDGNWTEKQDALKATQLPGYGVLHHRDRTMINCWVKGNSFRECNAMQYDIHRRFRGITCHHQGWSVCYVWRRIEKYVEASSHL